MNILVIGGGGREHALVWKLAQSPRINALWCAPGNAGISSERLLNGSPVTCATIPAEDLNALRDFAIQNKIDLTVVGPDNPLALGIVDFFQEKGLKIWGPNQRAAQFESSKVFSQEFMEKYGIPTAKSGIFTNADEAKGFVRSLSGKCAVKADGLALGKGVLVCSSVQQSDAAIEEILVKGAFGQAGKRIVIQEYLEGTEISIHALCDGERALLFPTSQDHKRALDGDEGLNTGGMGTYSPAPFLDESGMERVSREILDRWVGGCRAEKIDFRGILYPGLMVTREGPKVIEFNARFGDPETQVYMMRLKSDLLESLLASANGSLGSTKLEWTKEAAVCVVMASGGYPGNYSKGLAVKGLDAVNRISGVKVFHAGTTLTEGNIVTSGGRVLGVTAVGTTLVEAQQRAYQAVRQIQFEGAHWRQDIAAKALAC